MVEFERELALALLGDKKMPRYILMIPGLRSRM